MRGMKVFCACILFLLALRLEAAHGVIETSAGSKLEGDVQFDDGAFVISNDEATNRVELANLLRLRFQPPTATNVAGTNSITVSNTVPTNGLLGLYYNEPDHTGGFKTRYDATIDYDWGEAAPFLGLNSDRFSVRWLGTLTPQFTEHYSFHTVSDDGIRLYINTNLVIDAWKEEFMNLASIPMVLYAGQRYDFRVEYFDNTARAIAKLYWSSPSTPRTIIPKGCFTPGVPPDPTSALAYFRIPPGVMLVDGSILARKIQAADESSITFAKGTAPATLSAINVSRIIFNSITSENLAALQSNRPGLLLQNKDFIEGDFRSLKDNRVKLYSVLFGIRTLEQSKVLAAVLRNVKTTPVAFELITRDDSRLRLNQIAVSKEGLHVQNGVLTGLKVAPSDIIEIKAGYRPGTQARAH
jgi:hypothetical protein